MKTTWNKKRLLMIVAGVFVLVAVTVILCLLLPGGARRQPALPTATPTDATAPGPTAGADEPDITPEPVITPPAAQSGNVASGSDIYVSIQLPATDSDLG